jgi:hypothetical protein
LILFGFRSGDLSCVALLRGGLSLRLLTRI